MSPNDMEAARARAREIAQNAAGGKNQPAYCKNPNTFEIHAWVLDAIVAALLESYAIGYRNGKDDGAREARKETADG